MMMQCKNIYAGCLHHMMMQCKNVYTGCLHHMSRHCKDVYTGCLHHMNRLCKDVYTGSGADLGLFAGGSQSVVVICHLLTNRGGGRHMCPFTYVRVNVSWLLMLQSLRLR